MATTKLYRVVRERCYNGGRGVREVYDTEVLYCDYDYLEALRVYHSHLGGGRDAPGHYFFRVRCESKPVVMAEEHDEATR